MSQEPKKAPPLYFISASFDLLLMGGLSLLCFPLFMLLEDKLADRQVELGVMTLWWIVNFPHFSATNYRLYHARANVAEYPITALAVPVLVLAGMALAFAHPDTIAPFYVKLMVVWSVYHFAGQSFGITMIYARRAGFLVGPIERRALQWFLQGTFLTRCAYDEVGTGVRTYFGVAHPVFGIPAWIPNALLIGTLVCGVVFVARAIAWSRANKKQVPAIVYLPAVTYFVWFIVGRDAQAFYAFVPAFHSLQYLVIAWTMQLKERQEQKGERPSVAYVLKETARWGSLNVVGGFLLFFVVPHLCALSGATERFSFAIVATAIQLHHFFVDGVIWKLKNPKVASPLMANVKLLLGSEPERAS